MEAVFWNFFDAHSFWEVRPRLLLSEPRYVEQDVFFVFVYGFMQTIICNRALKIHHMHTACCSRAIYTFMSYSCLWHSILSFSKHWCDTEAVWQSTWYESVTETKALILVCKIPTAWAKDLDHCDNTLLHPSWLGPPSTPSLNLPPCHSQQPRPPCRSPGASRDTRSRGQLRRVFLMSLCVCVF